MAEYFKNLSQQVKEIWGKLSQSQKLAAGAVTAVVVLTIVVFTVITARPSYAVLFSQLSAEDGGAIVTKLQEQGIPYRVNGSTVEVPSNQVYDLRLKMASEGLPESGGVGFELFDKTGFSATEFTQKVNLKRALEGELARTITELEPVAKARVHIVKPEESLFTENEKDPTASIMLKLKSGSQMQEDQVNGIVNLVQKSVEGLKTKNIVVVDTKGNIISTPPEALSGARLTMNQIEMKRALENQVQARLENMLQTVMGPNKSTVKVDADMDFSQTTTDSKEFEGPPIVRSEQTEQEKFEGTGTLPAVGGVPGTTGNIPGFNFGAQTGEQNNNYKKTSSTQNNEITERNSKTNKPPGEVKKLSVAVLLDSSKGLSAPQINSIMAAAGAAAGINAARGDTLVVQSIPFDNSVEQAERAEEAAASRADLYNTVAKAAVLILMVGLAVYLTRRMLDSQQQEEEQMDFNLPITAIEESMPMITAQEEEDQKRKQIYEHVERLAKDKPDDVARLLERWLTAD